MIVEPVLDLAILVFKDSLRVVEMLGFWRFVPEELDIGQKQPRRSTTCIVIRTFQAIPVRFRLHTQAILGLQSEVCYSMRV